MSDASSRSGKAQDARSRRLAQALRENLRRRKSQARGRRPDARDEAAPKQDPAKLDRPKPER